MLLDEVSGMDATDNPTGEIKKAKIDWVRYLLIALTVEKIIQHTFVTLAFYFNWGDIDSTVAVNPDILMVLGAIVAMLFMLSLWGLFTRKKWAVYLIIALAIFDIVGEFIAQGKIGIQMNLSFLVATILLLLALIYKRRGTAQKEGGKEIL
jgi:hypothetical protein